VGELIVRQEGGLWTSICEGRKVEGIELVDVIMRIQRQLGVQKFSVEFDCEGKTIDGAVATFDFGAPDTYIPD
jgi:hypothetical protein